MVLALFALLQLLAAPAAARTYSHFQAIGFGIYTGSAPAVLGINQTCVGETKDGTICPSGSAIDDPFSGKKLCLECLLWNHECQCDIDDMACRQHTGILDNFEASCYLGKENIVDDVTGRVAIMEAAVERAYQASNKRDDTLKIFVAPEFYWRGRKGAYPAASIFESENETFNALDQIGRALDNIVQQERFQHWLFVFGTAVAVAEETLLEHRNAKTVYFNFAPVFRGFDPKKTSSTGMRLLVPKRYISTIDFLSDARFSSKSLIPNPFDHEYDNLYDNAMWNNLRKRLAAGVNGTLVQSKGRGFALVENAWFIMNGITFSLEICVDFAQGFAKESFSLLSASRSKL